MSSYRQATHEVGEWEEARLAELAQILALLDQRNLTTLANARIDVREEEKGGEPGANDRDDDDALPRDALFQVRSANGEVLAGSPQLHALNAWDLPVPPASGAQDITLGGQMWHSFTLRDTALGHTVRVFEPANTRSDLVSGVASRIARPTLIALPVLALLVWFSIGWSLAPLQGALRRDPRRATSTGWNRSTLAARRPRCGRSSTQSIWCCRVCGTRWNANAHLPPTPRMN